MSGRPSTIDNFVKGVLDGESISFHANGRWARRVFYKKGNRTGDWVQWFATGRPKKVVTYDDAGVKQGTRLAWYENGQLASSIQYAAGLRHGPTERWDRFGDSIQYQDYDEGQCGDGVY